MTTELISTSSNTRELRITVTKEEFNDLYHQELVNIQQKIKMPGFRPGRVPIKIIQNQYGASVKFETQHIIANDNFRNYMEKNDIPIVSAPNFSDAKDNEDGSQTYTVTFDTIPDFELKDYKSLEVYEPYHKVTDKEINDRINDISRAFEKKEAVDVISDYEHYITAYCYQYDFNSDEILKNKEIESNDEPIIHIDLRDDMDSIKKQFLNKKIGDEVKESFTDEDLAKIKVEHPDFVPEKYIIKKIEKIIPCEINDEFAKLASNDKFDNLEDYKQEVGFEIQNFWDNRTRRLLEDQILSKLIELHSDIEIPGIIIEGIIKELITEEKRNNPHFDENDDRNTEFFNKAAKEIAVMQIVQEKIMKKEKIELEEYDYENYADDFLLKQPGLKEQFTKDAIINILKSKESPLKENILKKKYIDFLLDFAKTTEIDYDEYIEIMRNRNSNLVSPIDFDIDDIDDNDVTL